MNRSTVYFWRESDSTIYPMLKLLAKEGRVRSEVVYVGKKKKELFSLTESGREQFEQWFNGPTGSEIPRNEFLLKLFFAVDEQQMAHLFQERLEKVKCTYEELKKNEERLVSMSDSTQKQMRLKALRYGIAQLKQEIKWLSNG